MKHVSRVLVLVCAGVAFSAMASWGDRADRPDPSASQAPHPYGKICQCGYADPFNCNPCPVVDAGTDAGTDGGTEPDAGVDGGDGGSTLPDGGTPRGDQYRYAGDGFSCSSAPGTALALGVLGLVMLAGRRRASKPRG